MPDKILSIQLKYRINKDTSLPIDQQVRKRPYILFTLANAAGEVYTKTKKIEHVNLHRDLEGGLAIARLYFKELSDKLALNILNLKDVFPQKYRITLRDFLGEYLELRRHEVEIGNLSPGTLKADTNAAGRFRKTLGPQIYISGITPPLLREYIRTQLAAGYAKTTINIDIRHIGGAFSQAVKNGLLPANPFSDIKELKVEKIPRHLWPEEEAILREYFRERQIIHQLDFYEFDLMTGLRLDEMLQAETGNLRPAGNGLELRVLGKGKKWRWVPVNRAMEIIERRRQLMADGKQLRDYLFELKGVNQEEARRRALAGKLFFEITEETTPPQFIKRARQRCRLPDKITTHSLRHTFAVRALESGMDIYLLSQLLGHSHITTTEIYLECTPELRRVYSPHYRSE